MQRGDFLRIKGTSSLLPLPGPAPSSSASSLRPAGWVVRLVAAWEPTDPVQNVVEDVTISPIYTIQLSDGSEQRHGDGVFNTIDVNVPAQKTVSWSGNAGTPEGIKQGAPIGSCVPEVMDVTQ